MTQVKEFSKRLDKIFEDGNPTKALIIDAYIKTNPTAQREALNIDDVIERFSGGNLQKLQKHFVSLYGSDEIAQEKANSFAVGFGKACELIIKDLNAL